MKSEAEAPGFEIMELHTSLYPPDYGNHSNDLVLTNTEFRAPPKRKGYQLSTTETKLYMITNAEDDDYEEGEEEEESPLPTNEIGNSQLERFMTMYPVATTLLDSCDTLDVLTLRSVSRTFRMYIDKLYSQRCFERVVLVLDENWYGIMERAKKIAGGVSGKLERDGKYRFLVEFWYRKVMEERRILGMERWRWRREVVELLNWYWNYGGRTKRIEAEIEGVDYGVEESEGVGREWGGYPDHVEGDYDSEEEEEDDERAGDKAYDSDEDNLWNHYQPTLFPPEEVFKQRGKRTRSPREMNSVPRLFGLPPITSSSAVAKVEESHPWNFFYKNISKGFLSRLMNGVRVEGQPLYLNMKELILDGSDVDEEGLWETLEKCPVLEGVSVRGCEKISVWFWVWWLETKTFLKLHKGFKSPRPKTLKWIRMFPSGELPTGRFNIEHDLRPKNAKGSIYRGSDKDNFPISISIVEHLLVTLPLILPVSPINLPPNILRWLTNYVSLRDAVVASYIWWRQSELPRRQINWDGKPAFTKPGLVLRLLTMTEVAGVDVDVGFCASGEKCFAFRNDAEMTIGGHLNRPVEECGTHVLVGKKSREERGGRKCKGCGVWEWEVEGRPNTCTDQNYRENRKKYAGLLYFGETKDETATPNASKLDTAMNALCGDVGGVRIARIIGKKNGIAAKGELMTEELEGVLNKDGDVFLGIGLGAGSVCEICEQNMTCWDCGNFYCQICLFGPGPHITAKTKPNTVPYPTVPNPLPDSTNSPYILPSWLHAKFPGVAPTGTLELRPAPLLTHTCIKGKHGPLCYTCMPKWSTSCDSCQGRFCKVCSPGGIEITRASGENGIPNVDDDWDNEDLQVEFGGYNGRGDWGCLETDWEVSGSVRDPGVCVEVEKSEVWEGIPMEAFMGKAREVREEVVGGRMGIVGVTDGGGGKSVVVEHEMKEEGEAVKEETVEGMGVDQRGNEEVTMGAENDDQGEDEAEIEKRKSGGRGETAMFIDPEEKEDLTEVSTTGSGWATTSVTKMSSALSVTAEYGDFDDIMDLDTLLNIDTTTCHPSSSSDLPPDAQNLAGVARDISQTGAQGQSDCLVYTFPPAWSNTDEARNNNTMTDSTNEAPVDTFSAWSTNPSPTSSLHQPVPLRIPPRPESPYFPPLPSPSFFTAPPENYIDHLRNALTFHSKLTPSLISRGYIPLQIYATCAFCNTTHCRACTRGLETWEHCAGCGRLCCNMCIFSLCDACERPMCEACWEKEGKSKLVRKYMPTTPVPRFNPWRDDTGMYVDELPPVEPKGPVHVSDMREIYDVDLGEEGIGDGRSGRWPEMLRVRGEGNPAMEKIMEKREKEREKKEKAREEGQACIEEEYWMRKRALEVVDEDWCAKCELKKRIGFCEGEGPDPWEESEEERKVVVPPTPLPQPVPSYFESQQAGYTCNTQRLQQHRQAPLLKTPTQQPSPLPILPCDPGPVPFQYLPKPGSTTEEIAAAPRAQFSVNMKPVWGRMREAYGRERGGMVGGIAKEEDKKGYYNEYGWSIEDGDGYEDDYEMKDKDNDGDSDGDDGEDEGGEDEDESEGEGRDEKMEGMEGVE